MNKRSVLCVTLERLIELVVFLLILGILNYFKYDNSIYIQVVNFLNLNVGFIVVLSILFYFGELFSIFKFPVNIPYPIFNAIGSVFLVGFIFNIFYMLGNVLDVSAFFAFMFLEPFVIVLVFIIVIVSGYVKIVIDLGSRCIPKRKDKSRSKKESVKNKKAYDNKSKSQKDNISWDDVGSEFKLAMYNLASTLKENLKPKNKKKNK